MSAKYFIYDRAVFPTFLDAKDAGKAVNVDNFINLKNDCEMQKFLELISEQLGIQANIVRIVE